jgi:hypothetical protein
MTMHPVLLSLTAALLIGAGVTRAGDPFQDDQAAWRKNRDTRLRSETGWLTLVGLHWLQPGDNRFGSDPALAVRLPAGKSPALAGSLFVEGDRVRLVPAAGVAIQLDGKPAGERQLADDVDGKPDVLQLGDLRFHLVRRGARIGVRVRDPQSPLRASFKGMDYFPADPAYRIEATFHPHDTPRKIQVPTVLGTTETMDALGRVRFTLAGKEHWLEPVVEDPAHPALFFIFKDGTSGRETYAAGRFLYAEMPKDGRVILDFNKAYNPPCVFTPYATCPLPPKQNWLDARIEAGEKSFAHHP